jgi:hypothetical protein
MKFIWYAVKLQAVKQIAKRSVKNVLTLCSSDVQKVATAKKDTLEMAHLHINASKSPNAKTASGIVFQMKPRLLK